MHHECFLTAIPLRSSISPSDLIPPLLTVAHRRNITSHGRPIRVLAVVSPLPNKFHLRFPCIMGTLLRSCSPMSAASDSNRSALQRRQPSDSASISFSTCDNNCADHDWWKPNSCANNGLSRSSYTPPSQLRMAMLLH